MVDPVPNNSMVSAIFGNDWKLENGLLSGTALAFKTSTFDPFFNDERLTFVASIRNITTWQTRGLAQKFFFLKSSEASEFLSTKTKEKFFQVELVVLDSANRPLSLVEIMTIAEPEPIPEEPKQGLTTNQKIGIVAGIVTAIGVVGGIVLSQKR